MRGPQLAPAGRDVPALVHRQGAAPAEAAALPRIDHPGRLRDLGARGQRDRRPGIGHRGKEQPVRSRQAVRVSNTPASLANEKDPTVLAHLIDATQHRLQPQRQSRTCGDDHAWRYAIQIEQNQGLGPVISS